MDTLHWWCWAVGLMTGLPLGMTLGVQMMKRSKM